jgi:hypothetical protein
MTPTRRDFVKNVGIAIGSLVMARCIRLGDGGDSTVGECNSPRDCLRQCWLRLDWLAEDIRDWDNYERGERARDGLLTDHRAALDDLVSGGELDAAVADYVQAAYLEAVRHVWRANSGVTCYTAVLPDYTPGTARRLIEQAELLAEMAESGDLEADAVARAQAAIGREVAFLSLSYDETQALYDELREVAGDTYDFPPFEELDLYIPPEASEAARFLVELLLGETE